MSGTSSAPEAFAKKKGKDRKAIAAVLIRGGVFDFMEY